MDVHLLITVFLSVLLEALPFVLVGVLVSALIEVFVSQDIIHRLMPKNRLVSLVAACLLGLFFPLCECGIVPVVRRLVSKGVPISAGIAFMLATPIINPVVITSTAMAFANRPNMTMLRLIGGFLVAFTIGLALEALYHRRGKSERLLLRQPSVETQRHGPGCCHDAGHRHGQHGHDHDHRHGYGRSLGGKLAATLTHATDEFFSTGRYLILGALLAAGIQTTLSQGFLATLGQSAVGSRFSMMGLAYCLSLCSEADAFVASTFMPSFLPGAVLSFLLLGPMIDIKNTLLLLGSFSARFVLLLIGLIAVAVFGYSFILTAILPV